MAPWSPESEEINEDSDGLDRKDRLQAGPAQGRQRRGPPIKAPSSGVSPVVPVCARWRNCRRRSSNGNSSTLAGRTARAVRAADVGSHVGRAFQEPPVLTDSALAPERGGYPVAARGVDAVRAADHPRLGTGEQCGSLLVHSSHDTTTAAATLPAWRLAPIRQLIQPNVQRSCGLGSPPAAAKSVIARPSWRRWVVGISRRICSMAMRRARRNPCAFANFASNRVVEWVPAAGRPGRSMRL